MFTLIKREIEDHLVYLVFAVSLGATMVASLVFLAYVEFDTALGLVTSLGIVALVGCCAMGVVQTSTDQTHKISSFLATLAVTRGQILAARILVGVLAILSVLLPTVIAAVVLLNRFLPPIAFYGRAIIDVSVTVFLVALTCYCVGLLAGSTTRKLHLVGACLAVPAAVLILVVAKGFGYQVMAILGLLILASIGRIATKLSSTPL